MLRVYASSRYLPCWVVRTHVLVYRISLMSQPCEALLPVQLQLQAQKQRHA